MLREDHRSPSRARGAKVSTVVRSGPNTERLYQARYQIGAKVRCERRRTDFNGCAV